MLKSSGTRAQNLHSLQLLVGVGGGTGLSGIPSKPGVEGGRGLSALATMPGVEGGRGLSALATVPGSGLPPRGVEGQLDVGVKSFSSSSSLSL